MSNQHPTSNPFTASAGAARISDHSAATQSASIAMPAANPDIAQRMSAPLFPLGRVAATVGALELLVRTSTNASTLLHRHQLGDWGAVSEADAAENRRVLDHHGRILSVYELGIHRERLWIITEHGRSMTTILLPDEV